jgi:hypothetical protein
MVSRVVVMSAPLNLHSRCGNRRAVTDDYLAVGMLNSGPLAMLSGQRCITLL